MVFLDPAMKASIAQGAADRANTRLDAIERRLTAIESHPALAVPPLEHSVICGQCGDQVENGEQMDGCRDPDCPCR